MLMGGRLVKRFVLQVLSGVKRSTQRNYLVDKLNINVKSFVLKRLLHITTQVYEINAQNKKRKKDMQTIVKLIS